MAAYRPDVIRISRYEWDISELPAAFTIVEVQINGRTSVNTLPCLVKMAAYNRKWDMEYVWDIWDM